MACPASSMGAPLHSFAKLERVPVEPNVLFFLDSSGSMLWPMDAGADERGAASCTFGDGTLGWQQDGRHAFLQEYYGRDMDKDEEVNNNKLDDPDNYHPLLRWERGGAEPADSSDTLMPNDSRGYKAKLVLWRIFNDQTLIAGTRIAFATYMQTFTGHDDTAADWYRYPHKGYPLTKGNDASPGGIYSYYSNYDSFNRFRREDEDEGDYLTPPPDPSLGPKSGYRNSWLVASGVLIDENRASKRALLRSDFRSYIDSNGLLQESLLRSKLLKWIDGTEAYTDAQCTPDKYHLGNPEIRFDGWRPMCEAIANADAVKNLTDPSTSLSYEGSREGDVADFFAMTNPRVITDYCQGNWLVLLTSGGQYYGDDDDLIESVVGLYNSTAKMKVNGQTPRPVRTMVLGFVDPKSTDSAVTALRDKLNRVADAGDDGVENGSATAHFATDVPNMIKALRQIMYYIKGQGAASGAPLVSSSKTGGEGYYYQARYQPVNGKQWKGDLVKLVRAETAYSEAWSAQSVLNGVGWDRRRVYTAVPGPSADLGNLTRFTDGNAAKLAPVLGLEEAQATRFARWLLGKDEYDENKNGSTADEHNKLFDIYHSGMVRVGPPDASIAEMAYRNFLTANSKRDRLIYIQANDGMVHGFNDSDGGERFAFIPPNVLESGRLRGLQWDDIGRRYETSTTYPRYLADGPLVAEDVQVDGEYRTLLMGLLGLGGAGMYVLDVTDPDTPFFRWAVENAVFQLYDTKLLTQNEASVRFWQSGAGSSVSTTEYLHKDIGTNEEVDYRALRFTVSTPFIGYLDREGSREWAFVMGNGSSRDVTGEGQNIGVVYVGRMADGTILRALTGPQAQRFVSPVVVLYEGVRRRIGTFFIGDMGGRIFKGVLADSNPTNWPDLLPVFQLTAGVGLSYSLDCTVIDGSTWLYAGTGDMEGYLGTQSTVDFFVAANLTAGATKQNELTAVTSSNPTSINAKGWYIEFERGERMTTPPLVYNGYVSFATFTPDEDICSTSGTSNVYLLNGTNAAGGWGGNVQKVTLTDVLVSGLSISDGKISLGVTLLKSDADLQRFTSQDGNMAVTDIPEEVQNNSFLAPASKKMLPFYWKNR